MSNQMIPYEVQGVPVASTAGGQFNAEQVQLLKDTICKGATDNELAMFLEVCRQTGLTPWGMQQIHAVKRRTKLRNERGQDEWRDVLTVQIGINGLALLAERTGQYEGTVGPLWCGSDGVWRDVWLYDDHPAAAKAGVWKRGAREPVWVVVTWREWAQTAKDREGKEYLTGLWAQKPSYMLAKCALAAAYRRAFPAELGSYEPAIEDEPIRGRVSDLYIDTPAETRPAGIPAPDMTWGQFWMKCRDVLELDKDAVHRLYGLPTGKEGNGKLAAFASDQGWTPGDVWMNTQQLAANAGKRRAEAVTAEPPNRDICPRCDSAGLSAAGFCRVCGFGREDGIEPDPTADAPDDLAQQWSEELAAVAVAEPEGAVSRRGAH